MAVRTVPLRVVFPLRVGIRRRILQVLAPARILHLAPPVAVEAVEALPSHHLHHLLLPRGVPLLRVLLREVLLLSRGVLLLLREVLHHLLHQAVQILRLLPGVPTLPGRLGLLILQEWNSKAGIWLRDPKLEAECRGGKSTPKNPRVRPTAPPITAPPIPPMGPRIPPLLVPQARFLLRDREARQVHRGLQRGLPRVVPRVHPVLHRHPVLHPVFQVPILTAAAQAETMREKI